MARKRRGRGKAAAAAAARLTKKKENNGEPENEGVPEEEEMEVEDTVDTVEAEKENEEIKEESMSIDNVEDNEVENKNIKGENIKAKTQQLNENESSKEGTTDEIQEMQSLKPANKIENKPNLETNMVKVVAMPIDRIMNSESSENEDLDDGQLKLDLGEDDVVEDDEEEDDDDDDEENELDVRVISDGESEMNSNSAQGVQDNTSSSTGSGATAAVDPSEMVKNQLNQIQQQVMSHIMSYQANIMAQFQQLQSQMLAQATGNTNVDTAATAPPALDLTTKPPDLLNFTNSQPNNSMLNTTKSCGASNGTSAAASSSTSQLQIRGGSRNTVKKSFSINEYDETHESESSGYRSPSPEMMAASSHDMNSVNSFINRKRHAPKHLNVFDLDEMDGPTMNPPCFKRKRTAFNEKQYNVLETTFEHNNFPEPIDQHCIALRIKTPYRSIKMWFQNRRASVRKKLAPSERGAPGEDGIMKSASDPDARWYCNLCPSTFIAKKFLDRHKDLHKTNTVSCSNCHMKFTHKLLLDTHRISKCSSKAGVDLSHINDDEDDMEYSKRVIEDYNRRMQSSLIGTSSAEDVTTPVNKLPLLMTLQQLGKQQQQQRIGQSSIGVNQVLVNAQHQHEENDSDDPDEGQSLEQLLMTQVKKAQERKRQEMLRIEQPERVQKLLKKRFETQNVGLTIIPMPGDNADDPIKIKEEVPEPDYVIDDNQHPSTLQDQITSILEAEKRASAKEEWLSSNITIKHELDDSENPASSGIKDSPAVTQQKRQTMHDQIQTILRQQKQLMNNSSKPTQDDDESEDVDMNMLRRRRRTTIFSESQLRILYLHYTYNNFPDPSMFKIIGYLAKLDAQVIKIWFQNERSRQRKRAKHIMEEANAPTKNYKCRECGMRFAMLTFLVKHSMRHIGDMDESSPEKICPICQEKCDKDQLVGHLRQTHNVNMNLLEEHRGGLEESLTCHLCKQKFKNQDELMMHKHTHLTDDYGEPPTCAICKTTFVNAICLEAHFQTHDVENWEFKCDICKAIFYDKLLVTSHQMGHGIQSASDDFTDRTKSHSNLMLQQENMTEGETRNRQTDGGQLIKTLVTSVGKLGALSTTTPGMQVIKTLVSTSSSTPTTRTRPISQVINRGTTNIQIPSKTMSGMSFMKLIPVQILPVSSMAASSNSSSSSSPKTIITSSNIKAPTLTTATHHGGITIASPSSINSAAAAIRSTGVTIAGAAAPVVSGAATAANPSSNRTTYITLPVRGTNQIVKVAVKNSDGRIGNPLLNQLLDSNTVKTAIGTRPTISVRPTLPATQISTLTQMGANRPIIRVSKQCSPKIISNMISMGETSDIEEVEIKKEEVSDGEEDPLCTENYG